MKDLTAQKAATTNACKVCAPLGAAIVFRGIERGMPFLHGSQGCSTYIRRYLISHFNEPIDIASSSFGEDATVFGGEQNMRVGLQNVTEKYEPAFIGIATTCLSETIGDDVKTIIQRYREQHGGAIPRLVHVSTPSYNGTSMDGFHDAVRAIVDTMAEGGARSDMVNVLPGFLSPADLRHIKEILDSFTIHYAILPDYSETLDGPAQISYERLTAGGTPIADLSKMGAAMATIQFGRTLSASQSTGLDLQNRFDVPLRRIGMPIGVNETDRFFDVLRDLTGLPTPNQHELERGRLIDAYVDGHKYIFGKRVVLYGDEDMVVGMASFLTEIGAKVVLCASGGESGRLTEAVSAVTLPGETPLIRQGVDFYEIEEDAKELSPDLIIGSSKGYAMARRFRIPLIRIGFPIHDRIGGQRILHVGYRGSQRLFDEIVNTVIAAKQDRSPVGYSYM
jgi:nitrogenase molybdenum-iron protein NifN